MPLSTSTHAMQTRSKDVIYKPKQPFNLLATKHPIRTPIQPSSYKQALSLPEWKQATNEFNALERNRIIH